jgi:hypothetical protein
MDRTDEKDDKHEIYDWFKVNADELVAKVSKRIEDLEALERTAQSTSSSVGLSSNRIAINAEVAANCILYLVD